MTLFFLILLTVSLSIYALQRLRIRKKPTIKPFLSRIEEKPSESVTKPMIEEPKSPEPPPLLAADSKPKLISGQEEKPEPPGNLPI